MMWRHGTKFANSCSVYLKDVQSFEEENAGGSHVSPLCDNVTKSVHRTHTNQQLTRCRMSDAATSRAS
jgi:hypothetical protein